MARLLFVALLILSSVFVKAQDDSYWYLVKFSDKLYNEYSLDNPSEFMSQRAIDRRERYDIPFDVSDLPISTSYKIDVANLGAQIRNEIKWFNTLIIIVDDQAIADQIAELDFVSSVVPANKPEWSKGSGDKFDFEMKSIQEASIKSSSSIDELDYGMADNQIRMLNGQVLHNEGYKGEGMVIAVLDAGFKNANLLAPLAPLFDNNQILSTKNYVYQQEDVYAEQNHSHGTSVLSTMGANVPGQMIGTAPNASYHLIVTEDRGAETLMEEYFWVDGAEYADSVGADVINSSLGYTIFDYPADSHNYYTDLDGDTAPVTRGADLAAAKGMIICNSAGNSGSSEWHFIGAPADADSIITVGAVDLDGYFASFSSYGPSADGRVKPNLVAKGFMATLVDAYGNITEGNGTSFSSPILAGAVACLWQVNQDLSNMEIIDKLQASASQFNSPDDELGYGIPNMETALGMVLSVDEYPQNHIIKLVSNPVKEELIIRFDIDSTDKFDFKIVDMNGRLVFQTSKEVFAKTNLYLPLSKGLKTGVYVLIVQSENRFDKINFVKN
ncbi:MAG: S8 family serine peptidase [Bacteroidales bacterium]|nr:S8 family serine peptidase [Bacteroidales bacterium]